MADTVTRNTISGLVAVAVGRAGSEVGVGVRVGGSAVGIAVGSAVAVGGVGVAVGDGRLLGFALGSPGLSVRVCPSR